ncbi:importin subunit alpha [Anaeramoeba flamelloides]|uniref:Importin subunit alpha n=1 Tax=Anaeramoeba flamelloides TaxID=1746091 RepID=A0ABQ8XXT6_9EUKA|nr:importin subunit alpha [Anaeramoeba flamelloides]
MSKSFQKKLEKRQSRFKSKNTRNDSKNKRQSLVFSLSKKKKDDILRKKRNIIENKQNVEKMNQKVFEILNKLPQIVIQISDPNCQNPHLFVQELRVMVSSNQNPPIDDLIKSKCVPLLLEFLQYENCEELQFESACVLSNIASGTSFHAQYLVELDAIPIFIKLLSTKNNSLLDQVIGALGNIASESVKYRDEILSMGAFPILLDIITTLQSKTILKNAIWAVCNCIRRKPHPPLSMIQGAFPIFKQLIQHKELEIQTKGFYALSYLSNGDFNNNQMIIDLEIVPIIINYLQSNITKIRIPCIRVLGNIAGGNNNQTQTIINEGALPVLKRFLGNSESKIRKETLWVLSNICAGTNSQIQTLLDYYFIEFLIQIVKHDIFSVKKECCYAITNLIESANIQQIDILISKNIVPPLINLLETKDNEIIIMVLRALYKLCALSQQVIQENEEIIEKNNCVDSIEKIGGKVILEKLSGSIHYLISRKADQILINFFLQEKSNIN